MLFEVLCTVPRLMEIVYAPAAHVAVKLTKEVARVRLNPGPIAANTRSATPRKEQAQAVSKGKSKQMDKGKMIEPEKPKKVVPFPLQTGRVFKIHNKDPAPLAPTILQPEKKEERPIEVPSRVAKVLKLVDDEEDLETGEPVKVASVPVQKASTPEEKSKVEVIEAPLIRKRTLKKAADDVGLEATLTVVVSMANLLANRRKQIPLPSVLSMATFEAFLAK